MAREKPHPYLKRDERFWRVADQLAHVEQRHRILALMRDGATAEQVSDLLSSEGKQMDATAVRSTVKRYLDVVHREDALAIEELREMEMIRLNDLERRLKLNIQNTDGTLNLKVVDRLIRLSERRSKLTGLDAAVKHEHFIGNGLAALGIEEDHLKRAEEAFRTAFRDMPDVVDAEEIQELPALPGGDTSGDSASSDS